MELSKNFFNSSKQCKKITKEESISIYYKLINLIKN